MAAYMRTNSRLGEFTNLCAEVSTATPFSLFTLFGYNFTYIFNPTIYKRNFSHRGGGGVGGGHIDMKFF